MRVDGIEFHIFTAIAFFAIGYWYANRNKRGKQLRGLG